MTKQNVKVFYNYSKHYKTQNLRYEIYKIITQKWHSLQIILFKKHFVLIKYEILSYVIKDLLSSTGCNVSPFMHYKS